MGATKHADSMVVDGRVLVVDDHALLAEALASELRHQGCEVAVVDQPTTARVLNAAEAFEPRVVLLDLFLGDAVGASIPLIGPLTATGAEVVVLTGMTNEVLLASCIEAGASGVMSKSAAFESVFEVVSSALHHERVQPVGERERLLDQLRRARSEERSRLAPFERLTRRESEVLAALMEGSSAVEIAEDSFVSLATVRSQIRAVLQKLGVSSQLAAVALAYQAGWTPDVPPRGSGAVPSGFDWVKAAIGAA